MYRTRTSDNWQKLPGGFDTVNARQFFPAANSYALPDLKLESGLSIPTWLVPYKSRIRNKEESAKGALHGYLDDYRLESLWSHPTRALPYLAQFGAVLTPDFSLYRDHPYPIWLWNTYRNRWLGAFWQSQGIRVIPSVSWSCEASYRFCFLGISQKSMVSISTIGIGRDKVALKLFSEGFRVMLEQLRPTTILCYGPLPDTLSHLANEQVGAEVVYYPTRWEGLRAARRQTEG